VWQPGDGFQQVAGYATRNQGINVESQAYMPSLPGYPTYGWNISVFGRVHIAGAFNGNAPLYRGIDFQSPWANSIGMNSYAFNCQQAPPAHIHQFMTIPPTCSQTLISTMLLAFLTCNTAPLRLVLAE
jgi:hypothetical protein